MIGFAIIQVTGMVHFLCSQCEYIHLTYCSVSSEYGNTSNTNTGIQCNIKHICISQAHLFCRNKYT